MENKIKHCELIQCNAVQCDTIPDKINNSVTQYNVIQYNVIQYGLIQQNTMYVTQCQWHNTVHWGTCTIAIIYSSVIK